MLEGGADDDSAVGTNPHALQSVNDAWSKAVGVASALHHQQFSHLRPYCFLPLMHHLEFVPQRDVFRIRDRSWDVIQHIELQIRPLRPFAGVIHRHDKTSKRFERSYVPARIIQLVHYNHVRMKRVQDRLLSLPHRCCVKPIPSLGESSDGLVSTGNNEKNFSSLFGAFDRQRKRAHNIAHALLVIPLRSEDDTHVSRASPR